MTKILSSEMYTIFAEAGTQVSEELLLKGELLVDHQPSAKEPTPTPVLPPDFARYRLRGNRAYLKRVRNKREQISPETAPPPPYHLEPITFEEPKPRIKSIEYVPTPIKILDMRHQLRERAEQRARDRERRRSMVRHSPPDIFGGPLLPSDEEYQEWLNHSYDD